VPEEASAIKAGVGEVFIVDLNPGYVAGKAQ
jgi:hypothetical protein